MDKDTKDAAVIVFLCPNGHRLHGPDHLIGKPGKCPHCGTKFIVPRPDEFGEVSENDPHDEILANESGSSIGRNSGIRNLAQAAAGSGLVTSGSAVGKSGLAARAPAPALELFERLWSYREQGAVIELYLSDGQVLTPVEYAAKLSGPTHGVFGVREDDGNVSLLAISWESVHRIAVRGAFELPEGIFLPRTR